MSAPIYLGEGIWWWPSIATQRFLDRQQAKLCHAITVYSVGEALRLKGRLP